MKKIIILLLLTPFLVLVPLGIVFAQSGSCDTTNNHVYVDLEEGDGDGTSADSAYDSIEEGYNDAQTMGACLHVVYSGGIEESFWVPKTSTKQVGEPLAPEVYIILLALLAVFVIIVGVYFRRRSKHASQPT